MDTCNMEKPPSFGPTPGCAASSRSAGALASAANRIRNDHMSNVETRPFAFSHPLVQTRKDNWHRRNKRGAKSDAIPKRLSEHSLVTCEGTASAVRSCSNDYKTDHTDRGSSDSPRAAASM